MQFTMEWKEKSGLIYKMIFIQACSYNRSRRLKVSEEPIIMCNQKILNVLDGLKGNLPF